MIRVVFSKKESFLDKLDIKTTLSKKRKFNPVHVDDFIYAKYFRILDKILEHEEDQKYKDDMDAEVERILDEV